GIEVARELVQLTDAAADFQCFIHDGDSVKVGDVVFKVRGKAVNLLSIERLMLNCMQRMSGIATKTARLQAKIAHTKARLLDTRKTTPGFRLLEKQAVIIGGGLNHRMGLYDMIMLKDNHIDFSGGITQAVNKAVNYIKDHGLDLKIEVEVRSVTELQEVIQLSSVDRIMLDNFSPEQITKCIASIPEHFEVEASGGINETNIVRYAETGVDFISVGALTHNVESLDLSFKAVLNH
ncbi:MAG: carboxylating nicotinate-nucleotide diphosphorylase, partial [Bacteroidota bacterium]